MGNLVRMPHSELHATVEVLDALGVEPADFERVRQDRNHAVYVAEAFKAGRVRTYPENGEVFELALDGDAPENQPLEMVRRDGYDYPELWRHNGQKVTGYQTRRFKLVTIGHCRNWAEVLRKLAEHGTIPEGQWRNAFKNAFPKPDGKGPVGVAGPSWVDPNGRASFPYVGSDGGSRFRWAGDVFDVYWRWLVEVAV